MESDFVSAGRHLEDAFSCLRGEDTLSREARQALGILIDAFEGLEHLRPSAKIVPFPTVPREEIARHQG